MGGCPIGQISPNSIRPRTAGRFVVDRRRARCSTGGLLLPCARLAENFSAASVTSPPATHARRLRLLRRAANHGSTGARVLLEVRRRAARTRPPCGRKPHARTATPPSRSAGGRRGRARREGASPTTPVGGTGRAALPAALAADVARELKAVAACVGELRRRLSRSDNPGGA